MPFDPLLPTRQAAEPLLAELVAIDSVNPDLVPGGAGEGAIAGHVAAWCRDAGLEVEVVEAAPGRPSVVAIARGNGGGRSLMLNAHTDTVGVGGMDDPFGARVEDGRLYGRGAYDMKGSLAAIMLAAAQASRAGLAGDVVLTAVCDEEHASIGVQSVLERFGADACVVTEPTDLRLCLAHKGFAWAHIETYGRAAHGSRPDLGEDAIAHMGPVLVALGELQQRLGAHSHSLLGPGSVHASLIEGGQELSSYPERCRLGIERRTLPGDTPDSVRAELEDVIARARAAEPALRAELEMGLSREPFEVSEDEPIVRTLDAAATEVLGASPEVFAHHPWMDSAFTSAAGIPTVVFGPAGDGLHAAVEYADLDSVARCAGVLLATARSFCK